MKQFPNLVDYESKLAFRHFYDAEPMPEHGAPVDGRRGQEDAARRRASRRRSSARSSASSAEAWAKRRDDAHRHPAVLNIYSTGAVLPHVLRGARHPEAERRLLRRDHRGDVAGGRQVRLDRSLLPVEGRAGAHPQPALPPPQEEKKLLNYIFFPILTHVPTLRERAMDNAELPDRRRRARGHEGGVHEGDRLLRRARHRVPRSGADASPSRAAQAASMFESLGPAARHHRGRERLRLPTQGWKAIDIVRRRPAGQGPRDPRDGRGGEPRRAS